MLHTYSGERLKYLRKKSMLTQSDVFQLTGICEATIYNVENGRHKPQSRTLEKLLSLYAIRIKYWNNANIVFEDTPNAGNIPPETTVRNGSPGLPTLRTPQKT